VTHDTILDLGQWCILRTAPADTVKAMRALTAEGIEAWTPVERKVGRTPRQRNRYERETALMPSYLFAGAKSIDHLLHLARQPWLDFPKFRVFTYKGGIPLVADSELQSLRAEEARCNRLFERLKQIGRKVPRLPEGTQVEMPDGPFVGLTGVVEGHRGKVTLVSFAGFHKPIEIASFLLVDEEADEAPIARRA